MNRRGLIDTHCHLDQPPLIGDLAGVIGRAAARGVGRIVVPSVGCASWPVVAELDSKWTAVRPAYGLHPWCTHEDLDSDGLEKYLGEGAVAVGEIGLDSKIMGADLVRQRAVLETQLAVAVDLDLPVILHCRGAFDELIELLERYRPRGVVHAYSRGPELAERLIGVGLHLGFGGAVTMPGARRARRSAQLAPLERIVLETDAPSIGLEGVAPEDVEPHHVLNVAVALAMLRGTTVDEIACATSETADELFRLG